MMVSATILSATAAYTAQQQKPHHPIVQRYSVLGTWLSVMATIACFLSVIFSSKKQ